MDTPGNLLATEIKIFLDLERDAVFCHGRFENLFDTYRRHVARWESLPAEPLLSKMQALLAATCLHLSCKPRDQFTAWTLNLNQPVANLFATGDNQAGTVAGRLITTGVRTEPENRLFVESRRGAQHSESLLSFSLDEIPAIVEAYYERSEQTRVRLFAPAEAEFLLVFGLPQVDESWLASLDASSALRRIEQELTPVEKRAFRFDCGCNAQRMMDVLRSLFGDKVEALFAGEDQLEVFCPRCGRRWWIAREDFAEGAGRVGLS
ncbi:MAG: hypothetical protein GYA21_09515 [Myxococcales bacterium]|nr:hypothetical protein [Myxococcales bacterium]